VESWIAELTVTAKPPAPVAAAAPAKAQKGSKKGGQAGGKGASAEEGTAMSACCFVVGRVVEVSRHPDSSKLYVERIDLGPTLNAETDNQPRTILSGLQEHVKEEDFLNRLVLVIANLQPRKIAGVMSSGMVLCASDSGEGEHRKTVLLDIPEGTPVGERVVFEGHDMPHLPVLKKKLAEKFEEVMKEVKSNAEGVVCWNGLPFTTSAGTIKASISNGSIS